MWNPLITVLPLLVLILVVWSAAEGDRWALPVAVGIGSFIVQSHAGYAGAVGVLLAWGLVGTVLAARRGRRPLGPTLIATAVAVAVMWFLPVVEQLTHDPGNLDLVLTFSRDPAAPHHVFRDGWHLVAGMLSWRMPWITGDSVVNLFIPEPHGAAMPVGLVALVAGGVIAASRRAWSAVRLDLTVALVLVAATITFGRLSGPMFPYLVVWVGVPAMLAWVAAVWSVWCTLAPRTRERGERVLVPALACALVVTSVVFALDARSVAVTGADQVAATRRFSTVAREVLRGRTGPVVIEDVGSLRASAIGAGVALELERHGIPIEVPRSERLPYGDGRVEHGGRARARLLVASQATVGGIPRAAGAERLAHFRFAPGRVGGESEVVGLYRLRK